MKYSSCTDIFDYLNYISNRPKESLYLLKRKSNIINGVIDIDIKRIKVSEEDLINIKGKFTGLAPSISEYLWDKAELINQVKKRILERNINGIVLDIDRFDNYMKEYIWKSKI